MYQKIIVVGNLGDVIPKCVICRMARPSPVLAWRQTGRWTDRNTGQPVDETTWFRVSVWGRQAEVANQYLSKGSQVLVEGRMTARSQYWWTDACLPGKMALLAHRLKLELTTVRFIGGTRRCW